MFSQFQLKWFNKLEKWWKHIPIPSSSVFKHQKRFFAGFHPTVWDFQFCQIFKFQTSVGKWKHSQFKKCWRPCSSFWACSGGRPAAPLECGLPKTVKSTDYSVARNWIWDTPNIDASMLLVTSGIDLSPLRPWWFHPIMVQMTKWKCIGSSLGIVCWAFVWEIQALWSRSSKRMSCEASAELRWIQQVFKVWIIP